MKVFADVGDSGAGDIPSNKHAADPQCSTKYVVDEICRVAHGSGTGDWRAERPDDGNEASQDHGPATIFLVEFVSSLEVAAAEEQRVFATVQGWTGRTSDPIAQLVTGNGTEDAGDQQPAKRNYILSGEDASGDEQGIAGQKEPNEEAGFNKNDGAYQAGTAPTNQLSEPFGVVEGVKEVANVFQQAVSRLAEKGIGASARERKFK